MGSILTLAAERRENFTPLKRFSGGSFGRNAVKLSTLLALSAALGLASACHKAQPHAEASPEHPPEADAGAPEGEHHEEEGSSEPVQAKKFDIPFAWESSKEEPLAKTRTFLSDALGDNQTYQSRGAKFFADLKKDQTPRATVVTCSDSRVQSDAWDTTPENDDFTIRNIGNQLKPAHGSVEYGVEHLDTPVLMIIGHTGCGAVKAALSGIDALKGPIKKELEPLKLEKREGDIDDAVWASAVTENVNNQVKFAIEHFGTRIREGKLTVVGAVYDFRNDRKQGAGKLQIVNVNGNDEPKRMQAFEKALTPAPRPVDAASSALASVTLLESFAH
jgi:carbonic anhydrase